MRQGEGFFIVLGIAIVIAGLMIFQRIAYPPHHQSTGFPQADVVASPRTCEGNVCMGIFSFSSNGSALVRVSDRAGNVLYAFPIQWKKKNTP